MSTFGCHSCKVDLSKYATYEESPCATCKLAKEYTSTHRAALFDSGSDIDEDESLAKEDALFDEHGDTLSPRLLGESVEALKALKEVIETQIFVAASGLIIKLVKLAKYNPTMFEVVIKKMQYPYMSYSEIGDSMNPKCSKQNVLYHLKHAVDTFPEIASALLTDTRFSAGRYALQTVANRYRQIVSKQRIQGILYGDTNPAFQAMGMKELNSILSAPFMTSDEAINFNPYIEDEKEDEQASN